MCQSVLSLSIVLAKIPKGFQAVFDSITERFFRAPGLRINYFERFFFRSLKLKSYIGNKQNK